MNKIFSVFVASIISMFAFVASAQNVVNYGRQPVVYGSGQNPNAPWGTPLPNNQYGSYGNGTSVQYSNTTSTYGNQYGNQSLPAVGSVQNGEVVVGYRYETITRPCTPNEERARTQRAVVGGGLVGAVGGHLHDNNRNSIGRGALIGATALGLLSELAPCEREEMVRVPIMRPVAVASVAGPQQASYNQQARPVQKPATCTVHDQKLGDIKIVVKDEARCDEVAARFSETKTISAQNTAPTHDPKSETANASESKENNPCSDGRIPLKVTKKGHQYEGRQVCTKPEFRNHPDFQ